MNKKTVIEIIFTHGAIVLSLVFFILLYINKVNPAMHFIGAKESNVLLFLLCIFTFVNGIRLAVALHRRRMDEYKAAIEKKREESDEYVLKK